MTRAKKPAPRKRSSTSRSQSRAAGRVPRFLRALIVSSLASFGAATYVLHPQWKMPAAVGDMLSRLEWPSLQRSAPVALPAPNAALVQTAFSDCPQFFPNAQPPAVPAAQRLREVCFSSFAILHNGATKTPVFVAERLNRENLAQAKGLHRTDKFYAEARVPRAERSELDDYRGSGYSRGHMAPAGDMATPEAMAQSFSLANMVPQDQSHNAGPWSRIEQDTRQYVMRAAGDVYVFTGPVYGDRPKTIGAGVAVPTYLYKVVYDATTHRSWVHWQANSAGTKAGPPIGYDEFVKRTGLRLLPQ
ncbi:DNA/RNA non-specific endonuclease [Achromobacter xylosoxidans]|jgi:endonuclease G|uniref:DNA/RNA non-specific endonuclease n=1 Tax=Alcaligenes xylosoxydans xylosoxydans TaxID=85698 RepID=UPI0006BF6E2A|nr:DNA/RNA non-specific endonuclease [Achromobacter xylosoxidans]CUJ95363.1 Nuclease precursor [Achromobacter xylosoxidans]